MEGDIYDAISHLPDIELYARRLNANIAPYAIAEIFNMAYGEAKKYPYSKAPGIIERLAQESGIEIGNLEEE
jgi:hypothetical protein